MVTHPMLSQVPATQKSSTDAEMGRSRAATGVWERMRWSLGQRTYLNS